MEYAKVFWSGNSQAIRLPKEFRFRDGTVEVSIRREGERLILEPIPCEPWPAEFWQAFEGVPADFERPAQVLQERQLS
ncbi:MAG TPA: type II toxin-antitoxin system VapB family antitoxin, partial [Thermoanaerobaculia bacterium]|nr:type II toxin-antitoxin system VapB family antitoxin [Thermoanaerobaculia bacterium]